MFVFLSLQILALVSVFIVIKSWSRCCLVILQPRMGGGGALRKDSLKDKYHSILRHSCHLVSIFLFRVNALFSVDIGGDIKPVCLSGLLLLCCAYPAHLLHLAQDPPTVHWNIASLAVLLLSFTYHIFIEHLPCAGQCCRCGGQGMEHNGQVR